MSSIDYKQKYLKYKNKYLELKSQQELEPQTGGFVYAPGKYLFFIPENKSKFDTQKPNELGPDYKSILVNTNGTIVGSLDNLTNYLGNCTKFLRVGKTSTGYDLANTYNTLYSNQSSSDVIKREAKDAYVAAKPYIDTTKKAVEQSWNTVKQAGKEIGEQAKKIMEKKPVTNNDNSSESTIGQSDLKISDTPIKEPTVLQGGEGECVREPKKIEDKNLLIGDINGVREDKLTPIVEIINKLQGTDPENKISRIILVEKPIIPGKSSTIDIARNFKVSYEGDKVTVTKK
jgi:hypothetical protein